MKIKSLGPNSHFTNQKSKSFKKTLRSWRPKIRNRGIHANSYNWLCRCHTPTAKNWFSSRSLLRFPYLKPPSKNPLNDFSKCRKRYSKSKNRMIYSNIKSRNYWSRIKSSVSKWVKEWPSLRGFWSKVAKTKHWRCLWVSLPFKKVFRKLCSMCNQPNSQL